MIRPTIGQCLVFELGLMVACSSQNQAPSLARCADSGCSVSTATTTGPGGPGIETDSGNTTQGASLSVSVVRFSNNDGALAWSTSGALGLSGTFTVNLPSVAGTILTYTGPSPTTLFADVLASDTAAWVTAAPAPNSGFLPGIRNIPSDTTASISVPLLQNADLNFVPSLLSTQALSVDFTKAQIVVKVVDQNGLGVSGVRAHDMGGAAMAYASGANWVDSSSSPTTDPSGRVMGINVSAASQPGGFVTATIVGVNPQGQQTIALRSIPIQAGFVSYGTVLFQ